MPPTTLKPALDQTQAALQGLTPGTITDAQKTTLSGINKILGDISGSLNIVSSNQALQKQQKNQAIQQAGNAITSSNNQPSNPYQDFLNQNQQLLQQNSEGSKELLSKVTDRLLNAQQLSYDAALGSQNQKYSQLSQQLQQNFDRQSSAAKQTAQSLNPYSTAKGALTAQNFQNRISNDYQQAAANLQAQADAAQQQLAAGNYSAYVQIQNSLDQGINNINNQTQQGLLDFAKQAEQSRQFEASLNSQEQRAAADDFRLGLTQINYTPEAVDKMIQDGTIYQDPTFLSGIKANGIEAAPGIISAMKQGSLAQQKQLDLQMYREQQLALSNQRLAASQEKMTRMQSIQMAQQGAIAAAQGSGYSPDDIKYAIAAAQGSTFGSQPTQADRDYYRDVQSLTSNAEKFRTELDKLANNSQARNALSAWTNNPLDDEAQTFLATQMPATYRIASIAFGQSGRGLSDRDFQVVQQAIGSGVQSAAAREQIFAGWLQDAQVGMASKLKADAFGGISVAPYAADIENASEKIDKLISSTKKPTTTFSKPAQSILDQYGVKYR